MMAAMASRIRSVLLELGEERFSRGMEDISTADRREIFQSLGVPRSAAAASARQRTAKRIRAAWDYLGRDEGSEAAEMFARHWLARQRMDMICAFLDELEVKHEAGFLREERALTDLPQERLLEGLRALARNHDPADVRLYAALMELPEPGP
jgi:hypothetical protein